MRYGQYENDNNTFADDTVCRITLVMTDTLDRWI